MAGMDIEKLLDTLNKCLYNALNKCGKGERK